MNILKVFQFGKGVQVEIEDATKPIQTVTGWKPGYKTTQWWSKNMVQVVALGAIAYGLRTGHSLTPEQEAAVVHFGMILIAVIEVLWNLIHTAHKTFYLFKPPVAAPAPAPVAAPVPPAAPPTPPAQ